MAGKKHEPIRKTFEKVSKAGLGVGKNGKLRYPFKFTAGVQTPDELNNYNQPRPQVGDFCSYCIPSGTLSAGTVGKILEDHPEVTTHDGSYIVQFMDGNVREIWRYAAGRMTEEQVREVHDYYVEDQKRPERVKVDWFKNKS